jgi:hypothetical protein
VQFGEPDHSMDAFDVAEHPAGPDRSELLIITDQPNTATMADDELNGGVQAAPADEVLAADEEFAAAFAAYLSDYGCRAQSLTTFELAEPLLEERPDLVLALVRDLLDGGAARA